MYKILPVFFMLTMLPQCNTPMITGHDKEEPSSKPVVSVLDTDFSKGRLTQELSVSLDDLARFHGHLCDGLVEGMLAMHMGLNVLYPDGRADRTNTRAVSKPSPCLADAALYLTGARYQYGSFYVADDFEGLYIVQRADNDQTVRVRRKKGVKPAVIDQMGELAIRQELSPCLLDSLKLLEDQYAQFLLTTPVEQLFEVEFVPAYQWNPELRHDFLKTDVINKQLEPCTR